jgi:hypothetical protein
VYLRSAGVGLAHGLRLVRQPLYQTRVSGAVTHAGWVPPARVSCEPRTHRSQHPWRDLPRRQRDSSPWGTCYPPPARPCHPTSPRLQGWKRGTHGFLQLLRYPAPGWRAVWGSTAPSYVRRVGHGSRSFGSAVSGAQRRRMIGRGGGKVQLRDSGAALLQRVGGGFAGRHPVARRVNSDTPTNHMKYRALALATVCQVEGCAAQVDELAGEVGKVMVLNGQGALEIPTMGRAGRAHEEIPTLLQVLVHSRDEQVRVPHCPTPHEVSGGSPRACHPCRPGGRVRPLLGHQWSPPRIREKIHSAARDGDRGGGFARRLRRYGNHNVGRPRLHGRSSPYPPFSHRSVSVQRTAGDEEFFTPIAKLEDIVPAAARGSHGN